MLALSPGQAADAAAGRELLERHGPRGDGPALLMDRAYEDDATRGLALALGWRPVVPPKRNRRRPWRYDRALYQRRNQVERRFRRLKRFRRIATRYDKSGRRLPRLHPPRPHLRRPHPCVNRP